jgi:flagellar hook-length control protein FliK
VPAGGLAALEGALFKTQLGDTIAARSTATSDTTASAATTTSSDVVALTRAVKAKLDGGTPAGDVVAQLAGSLAASIAAKLGISPLTAQVHLSEVFSQALQPNDTGPPGTNAERAAALVSRLRQIAELATRVTNEDEGQPVRSTAGNSSDAATAKANPAPDLDSILRDAQSALAASTSPAAPATGPANSLRTATAAAGDGRTVAFEPLPAIASGGDTQLGRALTRAVLNDPSPGAPVVASSHAIAGPKPAEVSLNASTSAEGTTADAAVAAFVTAFANALTRSDALPVDRHPADAAPNVITPPAAPAVPATAGTSAAVGPIVSFAAQAVHDAVAIAPPTPPQPLPQPQHVDANAVVDQVLRGMAIRTTDGQSEVRLRLVPEQLGDVSIKLVVSGGSVDASITAHTADAQSALAGAQTQLAKSLADAGLKLQSFNVGLAGSFADTRDRSRPNDESTRPSTRRIGAVETAEADAPADPSLLAIPSFGPPIYAANPALGALNYLV